DAHVCLHHVCITNNPNIIYVAKDTPPAPLPGTADAYRLSLQANGTTLVERLTDAGTSDNSTVHADARGVAFDADGNLLLANDGGLYKRTSPQSNSGI